MKKLRSCFFASPIGDPGTEVRYRADYVLQCIVRPALDRLYEVERADQIQTFGRITSAMIRSLIESELVVIDLTGNNPNVFYEYGIRSALTNKQFICLCKKNRIKDLPFDVRDITVVKLPLDLHEYGNDHQQYKDDEEDAKRNLRDLAEKLIASPNSFISPIEEFSASISELTAEERISTESSTMKLILDKLGQIDDSIIDLIRRESFSETKETIEDRKERYKSMDIQDLLEGGAEFYRRGEHDKAVEILLQAKKNDPKNISVLFDLGKAYLCTKKPLLAREVLEEAVDLQPGFAKAIELLALTDSERD